MGLSLVYLPIQVAISLFIDVCDQAPRRLLKIQAKKLLSVIQRSLSRWGSEHVAFAFAYIGSQYFD